MLKVPNLEDLKEYSRISVKEDKIKLLAPCLPSKVVCVGKNYLDHIMEFDGEIPEDPILFIKPSTSISGPDQPIIYPHMSNHVEFEGELGVVIRKKIRSYSIDDLKSDPNVFGFTCFNDVTARDLQQKDGQWTRAKSFETFGPLGPFIVYNLDPNNLDIITTVNGKIMQKSNTRNMIFKTYELVSFISNIMTLLPGDVVATGTPSGVGPLLVGDEVMIEIEKIGALTNSVIRN
ncbi:MAG: fumarylacetoacetate hydrolase family protein [Candidatus Ranarchaeia archaeon]